MKSPSRRSGVLGRDAIDHRVTAAVGLSALAWCRIRKAVVPVAAARKDSRRLAVKS
jgi:hypothetical protein